MITVDDRAPRSCSRLRARRGDGVRPGRGRRCRAPAVLEVEGDDETDDDASRASRWRRRGLDRVRRRRGRRRLRGAGRRPRRLPGGGGSVTSATIDGSRIRVDAETEVLDAANQGTGQDGGRLTIDANCPDPDELEARSDLVGRPADDPGDLDPGRFDTAPAQLDEVGGPAAPWSPAGRCRRGRPRARPGSSRARPAPRRTPPPRGRRLGDRSRVDPAGDVAVGEGGDDLVAGDAARRRLRTSRPSRRRVRVQPRASRGPDRGRRAGPPHPSSSPLGGVEEADRPGRQAPGGGLDGRSAMA